MNMINTFKSIAMAAVLGLSASAQAAPSIDEMLDTTLAAPCIPVWWCRMI